MNTQDNAFNYEDVIFKLPTKMIHNVCTLAEDEDLHSLLLIKHALATIVLPIYATRLGIWKDATYCTITLKGKSYRDLGTWKCSKLFTYSEHDVQLYCTIDHENDQLATAQVHCLCTFLCADFPTTPFSLIVINGVCHLDPAVITDFICLIDKAICHSATIMSPYKFYKHVGTTPASTCPPVKLSNLKHLELDACHFLDQEWSEILQCLTGSKLAALTIHCPLPYVSLFCFLDWHLNIKSLEAHCRWVYSTINCNGMVIPGALQKIVQLPKLERIRGPPCHLQTILKSLTHVPETLTLQFKPNHPQSYGEYVTHILEAVHLCGGMNSKLDVNIHFHLSHFHLAHNYKLDKMWDCPGTKSLYLFLPDMKEKNVKVSLKWSLTISMCWYFVHCRRYVHSGSIYGSNWQMWNFKSALQIKICQYTWS